MLYVWRGDTANRSPVLRVCTSIRIVKSEKKKNIPFFFGFALEPEKKKKRIETTVENKKEER